MQIEYIKNPIFSNAENTAIDCLIKFVEFNEELPFNAMPTDTEPHGREAFERIMAGEFGSIAPFAGEILVDTDQQQPVSEGTQTL